jgi:hypothetical protein
MALQVTVTGALQYRDRAVVDALQQEEPDFVLGE